MADGVLSERIFEPECSGLVSKGELLNLVFEFLFIPRFIIAGCIGLELILNRRLAFVGLELLELAVLAVYLLLDWVEDKVVFFNDEVVIVNLIFYRLL